LPAWELERGAPSSDDRDRLLEHLEATSAHIDIANVPDTTKDRGSDRRKDEDGGPPRYLQRTDHLVPDVVASGILSGAFTDPPPGGNHGQAPSRRPRDHQPVVRVRRPDPRGAYGRRR